MKKILIIGIGCIGLSVVGTTLPTTHVKQDFTYSYAHDYITATLDSRAVLISSIIQRELERQDNTIDIEIVIVDSDNSNYTTRFEYIPP